VIHRCPQNGHISRFILGGLLERGRLRLFGEEACSEEVTGDCGGLSSGVAGTGRDHDLDFA